MLHGRVLRAAGRRGDAAPRRRRRPPPALPGVTVVHEDGLVGVVAPDAVPGRARPAARSRPSGIARRCRPETGSSRGSASTRSRRRRAGAGRSTARSATSKRRWRSRRSAWPRPTRRPTSPTFRSRRGSPWPRGTDGRLTVWTGTQAPVRRPRRSSPRRSACPRSACGSSSPDTGGGFGGKHAAGVAIEAARLARAAGRPVKVRWSRGRRSSPRATCGPAAVIDIRSGADGDGRSPPGRCATRTRACSGSSGPYDVPNQRLDFQPADSPLRQGSYRALAATANHFARESHMDELAAAMGLDPLELRLAHLADERLAAVLRAAAERIGWGRAARRPGAAWASPAASRRAPASRPPSRSASGEDRRLVIERVVTAFECGAIVNPDGLTNQVEGAVGHGPRRRAVRGDPVRGRQSSATRRFADYRVPRFDDVPPVEVVLLDRPEIPSAGAGETPIVAIAPAIANAIFAATGVRLRSLPLVPRGRRAGLTEGRAGRARSCSEFALQTSPESAPPCPSCSRWASRSRQQTTRAGVPIIVRLRGSPDRRARRPL